jgi:hypothetical protein
VKGRGSPIALCVLALIFAAGLPLARGPKPILRAAISRAQREATEVLRRTRDDGNGARNDPAG